MLSAAPLYTPRMGRTRYPVGSDLDGLAARVRGRAWALGLTRVSDLMAVTDGGSGPGGALRRHPAENLTTILDWYHAAEHSCAFAKLWPGRDGAACRLWRHQAKAIPYEPGGEASPAFLRAIRLPPRAPAEVQGESSGTASGRNTTAPLHEVTQGKDAHPPSSPRLAGDVPCAFGSAVLVP
jgi:hypothetical protein